MRWVSPGAGKRQKTLGRLSGEGGGETQASGTQGRPQEGQYQAQIAGLDIGVEWESHSLWPGAWDAMRYEAWAESMALSGEGWSS